MIKKQRFVILAGFVLLVVIGSIGFIWLRQQGLSDSMQTSRSLKVAVILNLSGPAAQFDAVKTQTVEIAQQRLAILYPHLELSVQLYDAAGGPQGTASAVRSARRDGARFFLSGTSPTALAIANEVRNLDPLPVQMANAANPDFGPPRPGEYRLWPDWGQEASVLAGLVRDQSWQRLVVVHSADPYSTALNSAFSAEIRDLETIVVGSISFDPADAPDFRPLLLRGKAEAAEAVVVFGLPPGIRSLVAQLEEIRWDAAVVGGVNINLATNDYRESGLNGGLWLIQTEAMSGAMPEGSEAAAFRKAFMAKHNASPPFHALYIADGLYFIGEAYKDGCGATPVECVGRVESFESASGRVAIGNNGILEYRMDPKRVE